MSLLFTLLPLTLALNLSHPASYNQSPTTYIFGDFNCHHSSCDSHTPEDQSGKDLFDWLHSSDLLPLNNCQHHTLPHDISHPPSFNYNNVRWDNYHTYIDTHCLPSNFTILFLSEATHTFTKLLNDAATSAIHFGSINRSSKAWWSSEVADAVAKRRMAFEKACCSEEDP